MIVYNMTVEIQVKPSLLVPRLSLRRRRRHRPSLPQSLSLIQFVNHDNYYDIVKHQLFCRSLSVLYISILLFLTVVPGQYYPLKFNQTESERRPSTNTSTLSLSLSLSHANHHGIAMPLPMGGHRSLSLAQRLVNQAAAALRLSILSISLSMSGPAGVLVHAQSIPTTESIHFLHQGEDDGSLSSRFSRRERLSIATFGSDSTDVAIAVAPKNWAWGVRIVRFTASGSIVWDTTLSYSFYEHGRDCIAIDGFDDVIVGGEVWYNRAIPSFTSSGERDSFVAKLNGTSGELIAWYQFGTDQSEHTNRIAVAGENRVLLAGLTRGSFDNYTNDGAAADDVFVVSLIYDANSPTGFSKQWSLGFGSSTAHNLRLVKVASDADGNAILIGDTYGSFEGQTKPGHWDMFVCHVSPSGTINWMKQFGSWSSEYVYAGAVDHISGDIYVAGSSWSAFDSQIGSGPVFIAKISNSGSLVWVARSKGTTPYSIAIDSNHQVWVAGTVSSISDSLYSVPGYQYVMGPEDTYRTVESMNEVFLVLVNGTDGSQLSAQQFAHSGFAHHISAYSVAADDDNSIVIAGFDNSGPEFPNRGEFVARFRQVEESSLTYSWSSPSFDVDAEKCLLACVHRRAVQCLNSFSAPVHPVYCPSELKPNGTQSCEEGSCSHFWAATPWTSCTANCNRTRDIACVNSRERIVSDVHCADQVNAVSSTLNVTASCSCGDCNGAESSHCTVGGLSQTWQGGSIKNEHMDSDSKLVAVDHDNNVFVAGETYGSLYGQHYTNSESGRLDIFLIKTSASGQLLWAYQNSTIPKPGQTSVHNNLREVCVDDRGDAYVVGYTTGMVRGEILPSNYYYHGFVLKVSSDGKLMWFKLIPYTDELHSCAFSSHENALYLATHYYRRASDEIRIGPGYSGYCSVMKMLPNGTILWIRQEQTDSSNYPSPRSVAADHQGNAILVATDDGGYFNQYSDAYFVNDGLADMFVMKISSTGHRLWEFQFGIRSYDLSDPIIEMDHNGHVFIAGSTAGYATLPGEAVQSTKSSDDSRTTFIIKLSHSGQHMWSWKIDETLLTIDPRDHFNSLYGLATSGDSAFVNVYYSAGSAVVKLSSDGAVEWVWKSAEVDMLSSSFRSRAIITDSFGHVIIAGTTSNSFNGVPLMGGTDVFVYQISQVTKDSISYAWHTSDFDSCSSVCSASRRVWCASSRSPGITAFESRCDSEPKPESSKPCSDGLCRFSWLFGEVSICNSDCEQTRPLLCIDSGNHIVNQSLCEHMSKPVGYDTPLPCRCGNCADCQPPSTLIRAQLWQNGTSANDYVSAVTAVDTSGNTYLCGSTSGSFPSYARAGSDDIYVAKLSPTKEQLWLIQFGTTAYDKPIGLVSTESSSSNHANVQGDDFVFVCGYTRGSFPGQQSLGGYDVFIAKLSSATGTVRWTRHIGTSSDDYVIGVAWDSASGSILLSGFTYGTFPDAYLPSSGRTYQPSYLFVCNMTQDGNVSWVFQGLDGDAYVQSSEIAVAVDSHSNSYVSGYADGYPDRTLSGQALLGSYDVFLFKLNSTGSKQWLRCFGTDGTDYSGSVSTDSYGGVYVVGRVQGVLAGFSTVRNSYYSNLDVGLWKFSSASGDLLWQVQAGSYGGCQSPGTVAIDSQSNVYFAASCSGSGPFSSAEGSWDAVVFKASNNGTLEQEVRLGAKSSSSYATSLVVDANGELALSGHTNGQLPLASAKFGNYDSFTLRITNLDGSRNLSAEFSWYTDPWSVCDSSCSQQRFVECRNSFGFPERDSACFASPKPAVEQGCTNGECIFTWATTAFSVCNASCMQNRTVYCYNSGSQIVDDAYCENNLPKPKLHVPCTCGLCTQSICAAHFSANEHVLSGSRVAAIAIDSRQDTVLAALTSNSRSGYVSKLSPTNTEIWTHNLPNSYSYYSKPADIAIDRSNRVIVAGHTTNSISGRNAGGYDIFVRQITPQGSTLWSFQRGSASDDYCSAVATDQDQSIFVAGYVGAALPGCTSAGNWDLFVMKISDGGNLLWSYQHGTSSSDMAYAATLDNFGNIIVAGYTQGEFNGYSALGQYDAFMQGISTNGSHLFSYQFGTDRDDYVQDLVVEPHSFGAHQRVFIVGRTSGEIYPHKTSRLGSSDVFVSAYVLNNSITTRAGTGSSDSSSSGSRTRDHVHQQWSFQIGSSNSDYPRAIALHNDSIFVVGTAHAAFPGNSRDSGSAGRFVLKLSVDGASQWNPVYQDDLQTYHSSHAFDVAIRPTTGTAIVAGTGNGGYSFVFDLEEERYWLPGEFTECSSACTRSRNLTCVAPGPVPSCAIVQDIPPTTVSCSDGQCGHKLVVETAYSRCSANCTQYRLDKCVNSGGRVDDPIHCTGMGGWPTRECSGNLCMFKWVASSTWSDCSSTCMQTRSVVCRDPLSHDVSSAFCNALQRPSSSRLCLSDACIQRRWYQEYANNDSVDVATSIAVQRVHQGNTSRLTSDPAAAADGDLVSVMVGYSKPNRTNATLHAFFSRIDHSTGHEIWRSRFQAANHSSSNQIATAVVLDVASGQQRFDKVFMIGGHSDGLLLDQQGSASASTTMQGSYDLFVATALLHNGSVVNVVQFGSVARDELNDMFLVQSTGNVLVCGSTAGSLVGRNNVHSGLNDVAVALVNPTESSVVWQLQFGSSADDIGYGIVVDPAGDIFVVGSTAGTLPGVSTSFGSTDAFVARISSNGTLVQSIQFGSSLQDWFSDVALSLSGYIYACGVTAGRAVSDIQRRGLGYGDDIVIARFNSTSLEMDFRRQFSTAGHDVATAIQVDESDTAYIAGHSTALNFSYRAGHPSVTGSSLSTSDAVMLAIDPNGNELWRRQFGLAHDSEKFMALATVPSSRDASEALLWAAGENSDNAVAVHVGPFNVSWTAGEWGVCPVSAKRSRSVTCQTPVAVSAPDVVFSSVETVADMFCSDLAQEPEPHTDEACGAAVDVPECGSNEYLYLAKTNQSAELVCKPCRLECRTGSFKSAPCTSTSDLKCTVCSKCSFGSYAVSVCSTSADTVCDAFNSSCAAGHYALAPYNGSAHVECAPCGTCNLAHERMLAECTATADTICVLKDPPASIPECSVGLEFLNVSASSRQAVCSPCSHCALGRFRSAFCSATHDTQCHRCTECQEHQFEATPCNSTHDRQCRNCQQCSIGKFAVQSCSAARPAEICSNCTMVARCERRNRLSCLEQHGTACQHCKPYFGVPLQSSSAVEVAEQTCMAGSRFTLALSNWATSMLLQGTSTRATFEVGLKVALGELLSLQDLHRIEIANVEALDESTMSIVALDSLVRSDAIIVVEVLIRHPGSAVTVAINRDQYPSSLVRSLVRRLNSSESKHSSNNMLLAPPFNYIYTRYGQNGVSIGPMSPRAAQVSIRLDLSFDMAHNNATFKTQLTREIAAVLGISPVRIQVIDLQPGSVIASILILPDSNPSASAAVAAGGVPSDSTFLAGILQQILESHIDSAGTFGQPSDANATNSGSAYNDSLSDFPLLASVSNVTNTSSNAPTELEQCVVDNLWRPVGTCPIAASTNKVVTCQSLWSSIGLHDCDEEYGYKLYGAAAAIAGLVLMILHALVTSCFKVPGKGDHRKFSMMNRSPFDVIRLLIAIPTATSTAMYVATLPGKASSANVPELIYALMAAIAMELIVHGTVLTHWTWSVMKADRYISMWFERYGSHRLLYTLASLFGVLSTPNVVAIFSSRIVALPVFHARISWHWRSQLSTLSLIPALLVSPIILVLQAAVISNSDDRHWSDLAAFYFVCKLALLVWNVSFKLVMLCALRSSRLRKLVIRETGQSPGLRTVAMRTKMVDMRDAERVNVDTQPETADSSQKGSRSGANRNDSHSDSDVDNADDMLDSNPGTEKLDWAKQNNLDVMNDSIPSYASQFVQEKLALDAAVESEHWNKALQHHLTLRALRRKLMLATLTESWIGGSSPTLPDSDIMLLESIESEQQQQQRLSVLCGVDEAVDVDSDRKQFVASVESQLQSCVQCSGHVIVLAAQQLHAIGAGDVRSLRDCIQRKAIVSSNEDADFKHSLVVGEAYRGVRISDQQSESTLSFSKQLTQLREQVIHIWKHARQDGITKRYFAELEQLQQFVDRVEQAYRDIDDLQQPVLTKVAKAWTRIMAEFESDASGSIRGAGAGAAAHHASMSASESKSDDLHHEFSEAIASRRLAWQNALWVCTEAATLLGELSDLCTQDSKSDVQSVHVSWRSIVLASNILQDGIRVISHPAVCAQCHYEVQTNEDENKSNTRTAAVSWPPLQYFQQQQQQQQQLRGSSVNWSALTPLPSVQREIIDVLAAELACVVTETQSGRTVSAAAGVAAMRQAQKRSYTLSKNLEAARDVLIQNQFFEHAVLADQACKSLLKMSKPQHAPLVEESSFTDVIATTAKDMVSAATSATTAAQRRISQVLSSHILPVQTVTVSDDGNSDLSVTAGPGLGEFNDSKRLSLGDIVLDCKSQVNLQPHMQQMLDPDACDAVAESLAHVVQVHQATAVNMNTATKVIRAATLLFPHKRQLDETFMSQFKQEYSVAATKLNTASPSHAKLQRDFDHLKQRMRSLQKQLTQQPLGSHRRHSQSTASRFMSMICASNCAADSTSNADADADMKEARHQRRLFRSQCATSFAQIGTSMSLFANSIGPDHEHELWCATASMWKDLTHQYAALYSCYEAAFANDTLTPRHSDRAHRVPFVTPGRGPGPDAYDVDDAEHEISISMSMSVDGPGAAANAGAAAAPNPGLAPLHDSGMTKSSSSESGPGAANDSVSLSMSASAHATGTPMSSINGDASSQLHMLDEVESLEDFVIHEEESSS
jgi:TNFR/NGFR cysteine-rich region/Beta-propeller repeat/Thrombospondin type 1 domain